MNEKYSKHFWFGFRIRKLRGLHNNRSADNNVQILRISTCPLPDCGRGIKQIRNILSPELPEVTGGQARTGTGYGTVRYVFGIQVLIKYPPSIDYIVVPAGTVY